MKKNDFELIKNYMLQCMSDSAHDKEHVYRVLNVALEIAEQEKNVDFDIVIAACLLHDIGRKEQYDNPSLCHAKVGAEKAYEFLTANGFTPEFASAVRDAVNSHRFRGDNPPETIEAKILFDADKIDATGTLGIARTLFWNGMFGEPLYSVDADGNVLDGTDDADASFFQEYRYKLEKVYDKICTDAGRRIAENRRKSAVSFYNSMLAEVRESYKNGTMILAEKIDNEQFSNNSPDRACI